MELDDEDKLKAMAVPLREVQTEQRLAHNVSLHWAPSYPEHWLRAHTAGGAPAGSLRDAINAMAQSKKLPGSVRSLLTRATTDCRVHGERLRHILLLAGADGPTAMHRCDGVRRAEEATTKVSAGGGAGMPRTSRVAAAAASSGHSLGSAGERRGAGGGVSQESGGESADAAAQPKVQERVAARPVPAVRDAVAAEVKAEATAEATAEASSEREVALQAQLDTLQAHTAARIAELEQQSAQMRLLLAASLVALTILSLIACYAVAAPMVALAKVALLYVAPAALIASAAVYAVVYALCHFAGDTWLGAASCVGLQVLHGLALAALRVAQLAWEGFKWICHVFGLAPMRVLTLLAALFLLMATAVATGKRQRDREGRLVDNLRAQLSAAEAAARSLRCRACALRLRIAGLAGRTRRLEAEKVALGKRPQTAAALTAAALSAAASPQEQRLGSLSTSGTVGTTGGAEASESTSSPSSFEAVDMNDAMQ